MDLGLRGKTALVTGGSKGLGLGCAIGLAAEGCRIHLAARTESDLEAARAEIANSSDVPVEIHPVDLMDPANGAALVAACGDIDILVNSAGGVPSGYLDNLSDAEWTDGFGLKIFGAVAVTRTAYAAMKAKGGGVIVNIIGIHGQRPRATHVASGAANAALMSITNALGADSAADGIRVVGVNPGFVLTDRVRTSAKRRARTELGDEARWGEIIESLPRVGTVEQVADLVTYLASARAGHITGAIIPIDGGLSAAPYVGA